MLNIEKEYIINNAVHIEFPTKRNGKLVYLYNNDNVNRLPDVDMMFNTYPLNEHHYAFPYHFKYVLPLLNQLFGFGYKASNFRIHENIIKDEKYDISYLVPLDNNKTFMVKSLTFLVHKYLNNIETLLII